MSQFQTVEQSDLVEQVRDKLLAAIATGELAPGQRVVEAELARRMGISRGPIREAARLLQQWGVLTSEARRGFFVRKVSLEEIDNLYDYRICLEAYAARKAAKRLNPKHLKKIRELYGDVVEAERRRSETPLAALDCVLAFHTYVVELGGNPVLSEAFRNLLVRIRQVAALVNLADEASEGFYGRHLLPVVEAIEAGDPDQIVDTLTKYLRFNRSGVKLFYIEHFDEE
jgi:DNA-binding GntR family transcriptional regulator